jgi:hypothetical protein
VSATENQLRIPDSAVGDPKAFEVARVWVAHGAEHVTLRFDAWKNPAAWGIVLADLMRHLVNAYEQDMGSDRDATFRQIRAGFEAEIDSPTDKPTGSVA